MVSLRTPVLPVPRLLRRLESQDGSITWVAPVTYLEYESEQALQVPEGVAVGTDYGYDMLGNQEARLTSSVERLRFGIIAKCSPSEIDTLFGQLRARLYQIGLGKGYTIDYDGRRRWAYMRLIAIPTYSVVALDTPAGVKVLSVIATFRRSSPWFGEALVTAGPFTINSQPEIFTITNAGELSVFNGVYLLKGTWAAGITIDNTTNGKRLATNTPGTGVNDWMRFDAGRPAVEFSSDGGTNYTPDYLNFVRKSGQVQLMALKQGANAFEVDAGAAPNATFEVSYYVPYLS